MPLLNSWLCSSSIRMPLSWYSYFSFKFIHISEGIICLFLGSPKLVLSFLLWLLWLIISSYILTLHLLSVSAYLHKHCHLFLRGLYSSSLLFFCLFPLFHVVNRKIKFRIFYSFDARITLNYSRCLSEARLFIFQNHDSLLY